MRFMLMFKSDAPTTPGASPCKQNIPEMAQLIEELSRAGVIVWTEGLRPSDSGAKIRFDKGKLAVTDGPFAEAKEMVAGVAVVDVPSKSHAIELAKRFLTIAGEGTSEILEIFTPPAAA